MMLLIIGSLNGKKNMLLEENKLKDNFCTTKSIMKLFGLEYQKN